MSSRDCYRLVASVLAVADVFSVFTAKNIDRMSKNIDLMRPKTSRNYDIRSKSISVTHFDVENWRFLSLAYAVNKLL